MVPIWTKRADVAWAIMHQPMPDHLILPLESSATLATWAGYDWAVVRSG